MTPSGQPCLLVAINGNVGEWRDAMTRLPDRPRLPLPHAFGAAPINAGFRLSAIELNAGAAPPDAAPGEDRFFDNVYAADELDRALREVDLALLWGRMGLSALARQGFLPSPKRRVLYMCYGWQPHGASSPQQRVRLMVGRQAARLARGVVLMTREQAEAARAALPHHVPVIRLQVGIDSDFYAGPVSLADIAEADRPRVEHLLQSPYVVMPGDELRLNEDALAIVENSPLNLVRVSQYGHKNAIADLKREIHRRKLGDRLLIFERISYPALRFLIRNAIAYAGLVDATWQPAGWTVACECLACGLPLVLYEGLTSRELGRLGAGPDIVRSVPMRDTRTAAAAMQSFAVSPRRSDLSLQARAFAAATLDLDRTGAAFGERLARLAAAR